MSRRRWAGLRLLILESMVPIGGTLVLLIAFVVALFAR